MMNIEIKGVLDSVLIYNGKSTKGKMYVLQKQTIWILSRKASIDLGLIKLIGKVESSIFEGLGEVNSKYKISIKDVIPFSINVPRLVSIYLQILVKDELDKMVNL